MTTLNWLDFDYSENTDDVGVFDAMASVELRFVREVQAEIDAVIAWAEATFPDGRGPVEEGGVWDYDLQVVDEDLSVPRRCFSLSLSGGGSFCAAFGERFGAVD